MTETARILIIDDDPAVRAILRACYGDAGYEVEEAGTVEEARQWLAERRFDLVTVDVYFESGLGKTAEGITLAREIRNAHNCGIIMLSVMDDPNASNDLLSEVADDNVRKPFKIDEVLARTRAVLRRYDTRPAANGAGRRTKRVAASFAGWVLDLKRHEVVSPRGVIVQLTAGEFTLLSNFAERANEVLTREQIVALDSNMLTIGTPDRAVDMRISRLRNRLEQEAPEAADLIRTVRGAGYRLVADVVWTEE